jgi:hypothetical protein
MEEQVQETVEDTKPKIVTGFAVLIDERGNMFVERNPEVFAVPVERQASFVEIRRHCSEIIHDLNAQASAEYVALKLSAKGE